MTICELIDKMKQDENMDLKTTLEIRTYIPIEEKHAIVANILAKASDDDDEFMCVDSISKEIYFELAMIQYHTNLDVLDDEYDYINEDLADGLTLCSILRDFYMNDYLVCKHFLEESVHDLYRKHSVESTVAHVCAVLVDGTSRISDALTKKIDALNLNDIMPDGISKSDISELIKKYIK